MTSAEAATNHEPIHIVDCDAHLTEPADLWSSRAPAAYASRMPVQETRDGITGWYLDGELWASTGGNTIRNGREKVLGEHILQPFDEIDPAAWAVKDRLELLDDAGIFAQVLYPNGIGFASNHVFAIGDDGLRTAVLQTYNDFLVDVQNESGGRLLPQALLPVWDMDLTVKEASRLVDLGIRGFTVSDKPELLGLPELIEPYFDPMWDFFNESGAVANFHIGAGARREEIEEARRQNRGAEVPKAPAAPPTTAPPAWKWFGKQRRLAVSSSQMYMSNVRIVANLCMSNLFDRFPKLQIVSAESGIGWVPFMLESLEWQLDEMVTDPDERAVQRRRPTEYFRDHLFVMFWFEESAPARLVDDIGADRILIETDIPHPTCLYPGPVQHFEKVLSGLPSDSRRKILQDNAADLYRIALPG